MEIIKYKSKVLLNYSLMSENKIFESTFGIKPIEIIIGNSGLPQLIEVSLYGLKSGDKKEYVFESKEIFGKYDSKKVVTTSIKTFKNYKDVKTGDIIETNKDGTSYFITVLDVNNDQILIDYNHPLCDKNVKFNVEIIEITNDS